MKTSTKTYKNWPIGIITFSVALVLTGLTVSGDSLELLEITDQKPSEWPTFRGNNHRTGRTELKGNITKPTLAWKKFIGVWQGWVAISSDSDNGTFSFPKQPAEHKPEKEIMESWEIGFPWYDLTGNGKKTQVEPEQSIKFTKLFSDMSGMQMIRASHVAGHLRDRAINQVSVSSFEEGDGSPHELWHAVFPRYNERPHVLAYDMTGDGQSEVIVSGWKNILVYDAKTGKLLMNHPEEKLHHARKRGFVTAEDLDGDGFGEIIIIGRYASHVDVFQNDGHQLSVAWYRMYEDTIAEQRRITRPIVDSVGDYDGDGSFEIVFNLWNEKGDRNWHIKALDALTGKEKFDLPGHYLIDAADINADGIWEMFCTKTQGLAIPEYSSISIARYSNGGVKNVWSRPYGAWATSYRHDRRENLITHSAGNGLGAIGDERLMLADPEGFGRPAVFTLEPDGDQTILSTWYMKNDGSVNKGGLQLKVPSAFEFQVERFRKDNSSKDLLLFAFQAGRPTKESVTISGGKATLLSWSPKPFRRISLPMIRVPVIANIQGKGCNDIVVSRGKNEIVCLSTQETSSPVERWSLKGQGMAYQYDHNWDYGVAVADLMDQQGKEILFRTSGRTGAALAVADCNGKILWTHEFKDIQYGSPCTWHGTISFWTSARLTNRDRTDVAVTVQRNIQHTGITYGLDGRNGNELWRIDKVTEGKRQSGAGGYPLVVVDVNGNGIDEVLCGYGNLVWCAEGNTGKTHFEKFMRGLWEPFFISEYNTAWVSSLLPMPMQMEQSSIVFFCGNGGDATGLMDHKGKLLWGNDKLRYQNRYWQCLANVDGDGKIWIVEKCSKGGRSILHCYDPLDGRGYEGKDWPIAGDTSICMPVVVDIDNDGRDEVILNHGNKLSCIKWTKQGPEILWQMSFPVRLGPPVVGDVDGDGFAEVIAVGLDDYIYCVNQDGERPDGKRI